jgi:hypothetical protein
MTEEDVMKNNLRIIWVVLLSVLLAVSLTACGGGGGSTSSNGTGGGGNTITITGSFSGGSHAKSLWLNRFFAWIFPSAYALNPNDVSKVIVFQGDGGYFVSTVSNSSFSIAVEKGSPVGLIFVGANNNYLGYLTLKNGIDSLPLTKLSSGVNTIDLQTLSSSGLIVEPSHNPIGSELPLTSEEQTAIAQSDDFFASTIKNPDVDGNGTIDIFEEKFFRSQILYYITGGNFGGNLTPTVSTPASITGYRFAFDATDTNRPDTVYFTGPAGSGLSNSPSDQPNVYTDRTTYFSPSVSNPVIPPTGQYTVSYKTSTLTFSIPDQSSSTFNVIMAVPTVTLNADGTIQKVNWVYKLGSGASATLDPQAIIDSIQLQIDGSGTPCASYPQQGRIYNSGNLSTITTEHVLTCQNLSWSNVTWIYMAYNDVYDNHIVVTWDK